MARLQAIAPGLWHVEHHHQMFGFDFRGRMTVVRLAGGGLLLHSVGPIDDELDAQLRELGPVEHIVAPNLMHHMYLPRAIERHPDAEVWGVPGLPAKRRDVSFDGTLGKDTPPWSNEFEPLLLRGNEALSEVVFRHGASKSLVVTDLLFNIHEVRNAWSRWLFKMVGAFGRPAQSKMWRWTTKDAEAMRDSIETMLRWDFDRVVMAHGRILESDGRRALGEALWWMRGHRQLSAANAA
jgi:hypothetical protein